MTSYSGWLLLGTVLGVLALPGCYLLPTPEHQIEALPSDGDKLGKLPPDDGVAIAKGRDSDYPSVTGGSKPSALEEQLADPPQPKVAVVPEHTVVAASEPAQPPVEPKQPPAPAVKRSPLSEALDAMLNDRHQDALKHLEAYDRETQTFYLRFLPTLTILARKRIDELSAQEVVMLNEQLQSLQSMLRPRTELTIDRMCYCEWVKVYGVYQPLPEGHAFVAPSADRPGELVQLYVELRNFASTPRGKYFETRLASTVEIRDAQGQRVQFLDFKNREKPHRSLSRVNDYYNTYTFPVPPLPAGTYQLILQIADETDPAARRVAHKAMEFRVTPVGARPN